MLFNLKRRFVAVMAVLAMIFSVMPIYAASAVTIELEDVTVAPVLEGEAKIKVKAKGIDEDIRVMELAFNISGNMEYKSVQPLIETGNAAKLLHGSIENGVFTLRVVYGSPVIELKSDEFTDICTVVFGGQRGDSVTLSLIQGNGSWASSVLSESDSDRISAVMQGSKTANAASGSLQATAAEVNLKMDKISTFRMAQNVRYGMDVSIESEDGEVPFSYSNQAQLTDSADPTLAVKTDVPKGITYTVTVIGAGFTPVEKTGVSFDSGKLVIKNDEFKPGDFDGDGDVDATDKSKFEEIESAGGYSLNADYDRDGDIDINDANVFEGIATDTPATPTPTPSTTPAPPQGGGGGGGGGGSDESAPKPSAKPDDQKQDDTSSSVKSFTDLGSYSWAEKYIYTLKEKGIVSGTTDTTYSPASNIRRGDFILMLTKMLDMQTDSTDNFADVPSNSYYAGAIAAAKAAGIASGDGGNFRPTENITRQDLMALAYRAFLNAGYIEAAEDMSALDAFSDKDSISPYAMAPMAALVKAGIIQGADGMLNPKGTATRAEVAVMCAKLLELMA